MIKFKLTAAALTIWVVLFFAERSLAIVLSPLAGGMVVWYLNYLSEERKRWHRFYNQMRNFYVVGLPGGPEHNEARIRRFALLEGDEIIYVELTKVGDTINQLEEDLQRYGNDKGVVAYGYAMGFGEHRGETMDEYLARVEQSILKRMQRHELRLKNGDGRTMATPESKHDRHAWYVEYANRNTFHTRLEGDEED